MAEPGSIEQRVAAIAADVSKTDNVEFVHCQIAGSKRNPTVRVFIDKPGGVTLEDCATVSRDIETILDRDDFIPTSYVLEVSSPGLERGLFKLEDFERFAGQEARLKTNSPVNGQRNFKGRISGLVDRTVEFEDGISGTVRIPFDTIVKANLVADLSKEFKKP